MVTTTACGNPGESLSTTWRGRPVGVMLGFAVLRSFLHTRHIDSPTQRYFGHDSTGNAGTAGGKCQMSGTSSYTKPAYAVYCCGWPTRTTPGRAEVWVFMLGHRRPGVLTLVKGNKDVTRKHPHRLLLYK